MYMYDATQLRLSTSAAIAAKRTLWDFQIIMLKKNHERNSVM